MRKLIAIVTMGLIALSALAADPAIQPLSRYAGTYKLSTKWGGNQGTWKPFQDLTVTGTSEVYLNAALVPSSSISTTTNAAGNVQYKMVFADGSFALVNFTMDPGTGYFFDSPVRGWGLTGAYQPNSSASGMLDLRGVPDNSKPKPSVTEPFVTNDGPPGISVKLVDSTGAGIPGASVSMRPTSAKPMGTTGANGLVTTSAADGAYRFTITYRGQSSTFGPVNMTSGSVVVFTTVPVEAALSGGAGNLPPATLDHRGGDGYWIADGSVTSGTPITLQLLPGKYTFRAAFRGQTSLVETTVADSTKVAFVLVPTTVKLTGGNSTSKKGNVAHRGDGNSWISDGSTGTDGSVTLYLFAGAYSFSMEYRGRTNQQASVTIAAPAGTIEFALIPTTVTVQSANGEPVAGAAVAHRGDGGHWISDGTTASNGKASFDLLGGSYTVSVTKGGTTTSIQATVPPGEIVIKP